MIEMRWSGVAEAGRMLRNLPKLIAEQILERAVVAGADMIAENAAARAPRPAIRRRPSTRRLAESMRVEVLSKNRAHVRVAVGTKVKYAHLLEYGHQIVARGPSREQLRGLDSVLRHRKKTGTDDDRTLGRAADSLRRELRGRLLERRAKGSLGFVAARPFLRPAFDETRERVLQRMADMIGAGVIAYVKANAPRLPRAA